VDAGLGCIPRVAHNGTPIYGRKLKRDEADRRLEQVYKPYHRALEALLKRAQAMFGQAWLIDCHSMPAEAESQRSPDIVIGDRFGASCSAGLADFVESAVQERGYTTARNSPPTLEVTPRWPMASPRSAGMPCRSKSAPALSG
jgi:N-formylglutamate amidohydrolase